MSEYVTTIGKVASSGKVHMAHGRPERQSILCRFGSAKEYTTVTVAETSEDQDLRDVLLEHEVKLSKLCLHCFAPRFRAEYKQRIRAATEGNR